MESGSEVAPDQAPKITGHTELLSQPLSVINVGLSGFAEELSAGGVEVTHVDWVPPAGGDPELADLLSRVGS